MPELSLMKVMAVVMQMMSEIDDSRIASEWSADLNRAAMMMDAMKTLETGNMVV
jgi:hypothetical protein